MFLTKRLSYRNTLLFHLTVLYAAVFIVSTTATFAIFYYQIYSMTMDSVDEELTEEIAAFREIVSKGGRSGCRHHRTADAVGGFTG